MTRLIDADDIVLDYSGLAYIPPLDFRGVAEYFAKQIDAMPTVEPTLYGYKIEHLALIARVMQKDGVTPEKAVQIFKDVQTIALKVIDEINESFERTFEHLAETRGSGDDTIN